MNKHSIYGEIVATYLHFRGSYILYRPPAKFRSFICISPPSIATHTLFVVGWDPILLPTEVAEVLAAIVDESEKRI